VPPEIQMPRVFSPDAVTVSPTAAPSSRGDRPLGYIGGLKAFLTRRQVTSSPGRAAPPNSSIPINLCLRAELGSDVGGVIRAATL
jgi:hypothetical protein